MKRIFFIIALLVSLVLMVGCQAEEITSVPTPKPEIIVQTLVVAVPATPEPTVEVKPTKESIQEVFELQPNKGEHGATSIDIDLNLWTNISSEKIKVYPRNRVYDYAFDLEGNLWMAGDMGIIYHGLDGEEYWHTLANGLPTNAYTTITVSPDGIVWAGGEGDMLVWYDGEVWHDEGQNFPIPYDTRKNLICEYDAIADIDFDDNGNIWVFTGSYDIFTKVYGKWMNFEFPKSELPLAGGGSCAIGIKAFSENEIYLFNSGTHANFGGGYFYNGDKWAGTDDFEAVVEKFNQKRIQNMKKSFYELLGWHFYYESPMPGINFPPKEISVFFECDNDPWLPECEFTNGLISEMPPEWFFDDDHLVYRDEGISRDYHILEAINPVELIIVDSKASLVFANATSIYFVNEGSYQAYEFFEQDEKPCVRIKDGHTYAGDIGFRPRYATFACHILIDPIHTVHHTAKLLHYMDDGTLLFATDHLLAQWKDGKWRSFYFDTVTFDSVTVDDEGYIWVYAGVNGFLRFSPDIFDDYVDYLVDKE